MLPNLSSHITWSEIPIPPLRATGQDVSCFSTSQCSRILKCFSSDIRLASLNGIDAFALNIGVDSWQWDRVADAYGAALSSGLNFKLFPSFDMTSLPGTSASDAEHLMEYISTYSDHPNSLLYNGKMFVSTFSGENCSFGTSSINDGWIKAVKGGPPVFFVPSFFVDPPTLNNIYVMDGAFNVSC